MKVCTETHQVKSFGVIPEGSIWEDDSPYLEDASKFADIDDTAEPAPKPAPKPVRGVKKES